MRPPQILIRRVLRFYGADLPQGWRMKMGRREDISICRCAIAAGKRRAEGIPFPGCVVPRRGTVIKNLFVAGKCIDFQCRPTTSEEYCIFGSIHHPYICKAVSDGKSIFGLCSLNEFVRPTFRLQIFYIGNRYVFRNFLIFTDKRPGDQTIIKFLLK